MIFFNLISADETNGSGPILKIEISKYHNAVFVYPSTGIKIKHQMLLRVIIRTAQRFAFSLDDSWLQKTAIPHLLILKNI
jgi:hypothetical protein